MRIRMTQFWQRDGVARQRDAVLTDDRPRGREVGVTSKEIKYHLNAGHAVPVVEQAERAVTPAAEVRRPEMPENIQTRAVLPGKRSIGEIRADYRKAFPGEPLPKGRGSKAAMLARLLAGLTG